MLHSSNRTLSTTVMSGLLGLFPISALAEVSDKEPSSLHIWMVAIAAAMICLAGSYHRRWLAPVLAALPTLWFASLFVEIHSADVGLHLFAEQGWPYYFQAYASFTVFVSSIVLGLLMNRRRSKLQPEGR